MTKHRVARVADLVQRELSQIVREEVHDPRAHLATVSDVVLSSDLRHARVKVSVLGTDEERDQALQALEHATGFVRRQLAPRLQLRTVPELRFELDRGVDHSRRIDELLGSLPETSTHDAEPASTESDDA